MRLIDGAIQVARRGAALTQRLLAFARRQRLRVDQVSADAEADPARGQHIRLSVSDTGTGMDAEKLRRAIDRFSRPRSLARVRVLDCP